MVEQLFTASGEGKSNGQERTEQLFTAGREKKGGGEGDSDRAGRQRQSWRGLGL
jgi:hypothetical protein